MSLLIALSIVYTYVVEFGITGKTVEHTALIGGYELGGGPVFGEQGEPLTVTKVGEGLPVSLIAIISNCVYPSESPNRTGFTMRNVNITASSVGLGRDEGRELMAMCSDSIAVDVGFDGDPVQWNVTASAAAGSVIDEVSWAGSSYATSDRGVNITTAELVGLNLENYSMWGVWVESALESAPDWVMGTILDDDQVSAIYGRTRNESSGEWHAWGSLISVQTHKSTLRYLWLIGEWMWERQIFDEGGLLLAAYLWYANWGVNVGRMRNMSDPMSLERTCQSQGISCNGATDISQAAIDVTVGNGMREATEVSGWCIVMAIAVNIVAVALIFVVTGSKIPPGLNSYEGLSKCYEEDLAGRGDCAGPQKQVTIGITGSSRYQHLGRVGNENCVPRDPAMELRGRVGHEVTMREDLALSGAAHEC